jgi:hypothetical protein
LPNRLRHYKNETTLHWPISHLEFCDEIGANQQQQKKLQQWHFSCGLVNVMWGCKTQTSQIQALISSTASFVATRVFGC